MAFKFNEASFRESMKRITEASTTLQEEYRTFYRTLEDDLFGMHGDFQSKLIESIENMKSNRHDLFHKKLEETSKLTLELCDYFVAVETQVEEDITGGEIK